MSTSTKKITTEEKLQEANAFLSGNVHWQRVDNQGTSNTIFRGTFKGESLVLRLNHQDSTVIGVCRKRENSVLRLIQTYPWAAAVIHNNWQTGWCLMQDHGETLKPDNTFTKARRQIFSMVAQCQSLQAKQIASNDLQHKTIRHSHMTINYSTLLECYRSFFNEHKRGTLSQQIMGEISYSHTPNEDSRPETLCHLHDLLRHLPILPLCLVHHDLHPGNICFNGQQIKVIDWEYAGISNPLIDAIALQKHWRFSIKELATLPILSQINQQDLIQGLDISKRVVKALDELWSQAKQLNKKANQNGVYERSRP